MALAKRRGFVYPSSDLYGGLANVWDYGPVGTLLKNNLRDLWLKTFVLDRDDMVIIDAATILKPEIWEASGHLKGFNEALVDCKECKNRARADHLIEDFFERSISERDRNEKLGKGTFLATYTGSKNIIAGLDNKEQVKTKVEGLPFEELEDIIKENKIPCPKCGKFNWTKIRKFNQLVEIKLGVLEEGKNLAYLRGEIAQGIFLNYKNVLDSSRVRVPFGIAQQGKAYRNEITMGQFTHRSFEFDLMEFEYFIRPTGWEETFEYWRTEMWNFALSLGLKRENLRWREHEEFERSFYSKKTMDIEYKYPFGWKEMWGVAYRTDYDLKNHSKHSGKDLSYRDPVTSEIYVPHVIEPTFGLSRLVGILLFNGYEEDGDRVILKLNPKIAPYKVAVFPLLANKPELVEKARDIYKTLKKSFVVAWDDRGNIGKRYFAQDEIGTPWCVTVDFDSLSDKKVTVRDRDTGTQKRVDIDNITDYFQNELLK